MTEISRAIDRKKNIIKTISVGAYAKLVGILVSFTMVPISVDYLGIEQYGVWIAVSSLIAMLSFSDGGVGNALVNMSAQSSGDHADGQLKSIVSTGFFVLLAIMLLGGAFFVLLYPVIPWDWVLGFSEGERVDEYLILILIAGLGFFVGMPVSVVGNIQRGLQLGNVEAFWSAKGQLLALLFVCIAIYLDLGIVGFACAYVSGPLVAALANSGVYFFIRRKDLFPKLSLVQTMEVKAVLGIGGLFFVLQMTAVIQSKADNVIIANMLGPSAVTPYAICMQLFLAVPMLMGLVWAPLWPAYREALASGDVDWIKRVFFKSIKLALLVGLPAAVLLSAFGQQIITLWVGESVMPSMLLLVGGAIWMLILIVGNAMAMLLNGLQIIKIQIMVALSASIINIGLTIWLINAIGMEGAVYGSIISYVLCAVVPYYFLIPGLLRHHAGRVKES